MARFLGLRQSHTDPSAGMHNDWSLLPARHREDVRESALFKGDEPRSKDGRGTVAFRAISANLYLHILRYLLGDQDPHRQKDHIPESIRLE